MPPRRTYRNTGRRQVRYSRKMSLLTKRKGPLRDNRKLSRKFLFPRDSRPRIHAPFMLMNRLIAKGRRAFRRHGGVVAPYKRKIFTNY